MTIKSADRTLQILELVARKKGGFRHTEIAHALKIPTSSLSGLLSTIHAKDYLAFDEEKKRYKLGPQVLLLATRYLAELDIVKFAQPIIEEIAHKSGEAVSLAVRYGHEAMFICKQESYHALVPRLGLGERIPLYATAVGKILLAYLSKEELNQYLSSAKITPLTKSTITIPRKLIKELESISKKGIAYSREEQVEGIYGMAVPVFDYTNKVVAGITIAIPKPRFNRKRETFIKDILIESSAKLSQLLGFQIN